MLLAVVLASGYSKRMGKDKLKLPLGSLTILERSLQTVTASNLKDIVVVCKDEDYGQLIREFNLTYIINENNTGIASSICCAMTALEEKPADGYMFILADMPLIEVNTLNILIESFKLNPASIIIPTYKGRRGNPKVFPVNLKSELKRLQGDVGARSILDKHKDIILEIEVEDENILIDIDTISQYKALVKGECIND